MSKRRLVPINKQTFLAGHPTCSGCTDERSGPVSAAPPVQVREHLDKEIAADALQVIRSHLWYLHPQTVVFTLFSPSVDTADQDEMAQKLSSVTAHESYAIANVSVDDDTLLQDPIDEQSWLLFKKLGHRDATWLITPASTSSDDPQHRHERHVD